MGTRSATGSGSSANSNSPHQAPVAIAGVVGADGLTGEVLFCGLVEAVGEGVGEGVAFGLEGCEDLVGEVAGVGVFEEGAVWGAFAGGVVAVGGV